PMRPEPHPPQARGSATQTPASTQPPTCRTGGERNGRQGCGYVRRRSWLELGINHLNRSNFYATATFENRAIFRHLGSLFERLGPNEKVSADTLLAFGKRAVRDHLPGTQNFTCTLQRVTGDVLSLIAQPLNPAHPLAHLCLHLLR